MRKRMYGVLGACALASGLFYGCTSAATSVTGPTADNKCQLTATSSPSSFNADGGSGTIAISTARDCSWSINSSPGWVTLTTRSGQGGASVSFTVAANPVPSPRSGAIAVSDRTLQLNQAAAPCRYNLSRTQDSIGAPGGALSVGVSTLSGCSWTATSGASWITVTSGQSGNADGTVGLTVAANSGIARVGQVNVAGQTYTVNQAAAAADPSPSPSPPPPDPSPSPSPSPGQSITITGIVVAPSGHCPNLSFYINTYNVVTDKDTRFKHISCGDVEKGGRMVTVDGVLDSSGIVYANAVSKADQ